MHTPSMAKPRLSAFYGFAILICSSCGFMDSTIAPELDLESVHGMNELIEDEFFAFLPPLGKTRLYSSESTRID